MKSIEFSEKELEVIIAGLRERETKMYSNSVQYRDYGNKAAQLDCLNEMKIASTLRERLEKINK